jgi:hypothetical protein
MAVERAIIASFEAASQHLLRRTRENARNLGIAIWKSCLLKYLLCIFSASPQIPGQ